MDICDIPTHIVTWGKWIEESLGDTKEIVLCITGNPGTPGYYKKFVSTIHANLDPNIPVWLIGHAGHDNPREGSIRKVPPLTGNEDKYNLQGQIKHKVDFIQKYIPVNVKIHLVGHSIGAWIILQLLKQPAIKNRVQKCYLLFPTFERMQESRDGLLFTYLCAPFITFYLFLLRFFIMLPVPIRVFLIYIYFWVFSIPKIFTGTTLKYLTPSVIEKVVFLANDEMDVVKELEADTIANNIDLLKFYYGTKDGWVPVQYYNEIKERFPKIDATLDDKGIYHAFVLRSWEEMGLVVAKWFEENSVTNRSAIRN